MNNSETNQCRNCGTIFTDVYCNHCSQKIHHRITIGHIWHDALHAITHADKGIFYLMRQLFIRPGVVASEYIIDGKRKKYFNPFSYVLILGSLATFVAVNSHFMEKSLGILDASSLAKPGMKKMIEYMEYATKYYNAIQLSQIPFFALGTFLLFRRNRLFYAEHLTLHCFVTAQNIIFSIIIMVISGFMSNVSVNISVISILINLFYYLWATKQFFGGKPFSGYAKAFLSYVLGFIFYCLFIFVISVVGSLIYFSLFHKK